MALVERRNDRAGQRGRRGRCRVRTASGSTTSVAPTKRASRSCSASDALRERLLVDAERSKAVAVPYIEWARRIPEPKTGTLRLPALAVSTRVLHRGRGRARDCAPEGHPGRRVDLPHPLGDVLAGHQGPDGALHLPQEGAVVRLLAGPREAADQDRVPHRAHVPRRRGQRDDEAHRPGADLLPGGARSRTTSTGWTPTSSPSTSTTGWTSTTSRTPSTASTPRRWGSIRRVGNPTVDDFGIAGFYSRSDRREWLAKCGACGEWQALDFWRQRRPGHPRRRVREVPQGAGRAPGEWVAQHPSKPVRGYHTPPMVPGSILRKIIVNSQNTTRTPRRLPQQGLGVPVRRLRGPPQRAQLAAAQSIRGRDEMLFECRSDRREDDGRRRGVEARP